jgi:hypothetical protein
LSLSFLFVAFGVFDGFGSPREHEVGERGIHNG